MATLRCRPTSEIPWGGSRLIVGTEAYGIAPASRMIFGGKRSQSRVELVALPTADACA